MDIDAVFDGRVCLTMAQLADALEIDVRTLRAHVRAGRIDYVLVGAGLRRPRRRFLRDQVAAFLEGQKRRHAPSGIDRRVVERVAARILGDGPRTRGRRG